MQRPPRMIKPAWTWKIGAWVERKLFQCWKTSSLRELLKKVQAAYEISLAPWIAKHASFLYWPLIIP